MMKLSFNGFFIENLPFCDRTVLIDEQKKIPLHFSGAVTPKSPRQLARTERTLSASFRRAASRAGVSPLMRQAL